MFAFLVTVLKLPYLLYGIAKGLRYLLYIGVQDQDLSFAMICNMDLTYWNRAIQFLSSVFFGVFLAGHPEFGATTLKQEKSH